MTQVEVIQLGKELLSIHGLTQKGWKFELDGAKRRLGVCKFYSRTIGLSKSYLPYMKPSSIKDTILHEIAHALVGAEHGHDRVWRAKAREIGCKDNRCANLKTELYDGAVDQLAKQAKYMLKCPKCGKESPMHRKPKRNRSCGSCGNGTYNPAFKLVLIQNY